MVVVVIQWIQLVPKSSETHGEIQDVQKEVSQLETDQKKLQQLQTFLQSDFFAEKEARVKLGMQKKDEHVVVLEGDDSNSTNTQKVVQGDQKNSSLQQDGFEPEKTKNAMVWWHYFFDDISF